MMKINQKLKWLLMVLPLTGCSSNVPLDVPQSTAISVYSKSSVHAPMQAAVNQEVNAVSHENKHNDEKPLSELKKKNVTPTILPNLLDRPGDPKALTQTNNVVSKPVNIDPNVKLIAPPIGMPKTAYVVPEVTEKENFVASSSKAKSKTSVVANTTTCTKGKNGKKICKASPKAEVKSKKSSSSEKVKKSSAKNTSKKTTNTPKKKPAAQTKKKESKN